MELKDFYMILDDKDYGIGKISMSNYNPIVHREKRLGHIIDIYSKEELHMFSFYTANSYTEFNKFELNKKINLITGNYDYVDESDFYFKSENSSYILTDEDVKIFMTKIDENKFILECEVFNLTTEQLPTSDDNTQDKHLMIKTILNFNNLKD